MLKIVEMFNRSIHQKPTYRIIESVHPCTPIYECHKRSSWTWSNHWGNKKDTTWDSGFQNIYLHMLEFTNPKKHHQNRTSTVYSPTAISKSKSSEPLNIPLSHLMKYQLVENGFPILWFIIIPSKFCIVQVPSS